MHRSPDLISADNSELASSHMSSTSSQEPHTHTDTNADTHTDSFTDAHVNADTCAHNRTSETWSPGAQHACMQPKDACTHADQGTCATSPQHHELATTEHSTATNLSTICARQSEVEHICRDDDKNNHRNKDNSSHAHEDLQSGVKHICSDDDEHDHRNHENSSHIHDDQSSSLNDENQDTKHDDHDDSVHVHDQHEHSHAHDVTNNSENINEAGNGTYTCDESKVDDLDMPCNNHDEKMNESRHGDVDISCNTHDNQSYAVSPSDVNTNNASDDKTENIHETRHGDLDNSCSTHDKKMNDTSHGDLNISLNTHVHQSYTQNISAETLQDTSCDSESSLVHYIPCGHATVRSSLVEVQCLSLSDTSINTSVSNNVSAVKKTSGLSKSFFATQHACTTESTHVHNNSSMTENEEQGTCILEQVRETASSNRQDTSCTKEGADTGSPSGSPQTQTQTLVEGTDTSFDVNDTTQTQAQTQTQNESDEAHDIGAGTACVYSEATASLGNGQKKVAGVGLMVRRVAGNMTICAILEDGPAYGVLEVNVCMYIIVCVPLFFCM
jgi:hypothetical protein